MKCEECEFVVYEGDRYCGNCGHPQKDSLPTFSNVKEKNILEFLIVLIKTPSRIVGEDTKFNTRLYVEVLAIAILLMTLVGTIAVQDNYYNTADVLISFINYTLIYLIMFGAYFSVLFIYVLVVLNDRPKTITIFKGFSAVSFFAAIFFILASTFSLFKIAYLPIVLDIFGILTLVVGSVYIINKYNNSEKKFDGFYSLLLYVFLSGAVTYAIYYYWITNIFNEAFNNISF